MANKTDKEHEPAQTILYDAARTGSPEPAKTPGVEPQSAERSPYAPIGDQAEKEAASEPSRRNNILIAWILICVVLIVIMAMIRHSREKRSVAVAPKAGKAAAFVDPDYSLKISVRSFVRQALAEQDRVDTGIANAQKEMDKAAASAKSSRAILNDPGSWKFDRNRLRSEATSTQLLLDAMNTQLTRAKMLKDRLVAEIDVSSRFIFGELDAREYLEQSVAMRVDPQYCSFFDTDMQIACRDIVVLTTREAVNRGLLSRDKALTTMAGFMNASETPTERNFWKFAMEQIRLGRK
jgi:hypothetical protein